MADNDTPRSGTTHFGAQTVPEGEKAGMVRDLFSDVANRRVAQATYPSNSSNARVPVTQRFAT